MWTRVGKMISSLDVVETNETCMLCHRRIEGEMLRFSPCGHKLHTCCLLQVSHLRAVMLSETNRCPVCNVEMTKVEDLTARKRALRRLGILEKMVEGSEDNNINMDQILGLLGRYDVKLDTLTPPNNPNRKEMLNFIGEVKAKITAVPGSHVEETKDSDEKPSEGEDFPYEILEDQELLNVYNYAKAIVDRARASMPE